MFCSFALRRAFALGISAIGATGLTSFVAVGSSVVIQEFDVSGLFFIVNVADAVAMTAFEIDGVAVMAVEAGVVTVIAVDFAVFGTIIAV